MGKKKKNEKHRSLKLSRTQGYTVVVPIFDHTNIEWVVQFALYMARAHHGRVLLVGTVLIPAGESLTTGTATAQTRRSTLDKLRARFKDEPIYIKPRIRVAHEPWRALAKVVAKEQTNLVVVPWHRDGIKPFLAIDIDRLLGCLNCHVVVVGGNLPTKLNHILMPIRGNQEAPLTLHVALSLAKAVGARITILNATGDDFSPASQQIYKELVRISQGNPLIKQHLQVSDRALPAILDQVDHHDLIIMGASEAAPGLGAQNIGQIPRQLQHTYAGPVIVVKTHHPPPLISMGTWNRAEPLPATPTSVVVDKWFAENTFSSQEFEDLERLVALKEEQNITVSLGLPTLNEEDTVGNVITTVRDSLMVNVPLLDEVVLIDSGSTDYTVEIARDHGIPVYQHSEILPQYGSVRGKGEALWKSLYVLKGDLVAWIDTDIVNIHPRFVYGVLGPLLRHETIQYVKGFYRRPLKVGETFQAGSGGRVTELVARPMLNLFYPELSGIVQPLSGEYAGRRSVLEQMPFDVGYGVETGLLLNLVQQFGISGIAQVDLLERIHHNQSLRALSRMAFAIIQVFVDHLEERNEVDLLHEINRTMKIIRYELDCYTLEERPISDKRRQPIITLPEYGTRHNITDWPETVFDLEEVTDPVGEFWT